MSCLPFNACLVFVFILIQTSLPLIPLVRPPRPTLSSDNDGKATLINTSIHFNCSSDVHVGNSMTYSLRLNGQLVKTGVITDPSNQGVLTIAGDKLAQSGTYECVTAINNVDSRPSNTVAVHVVSKPLTPTLTSNLKEPTEGDSIVLTCTSATAGVTSYHFFKQGNRTAFFVASVGNSHTIAPAVLDTDNANYTCMAYIDNVASDGSLPFALQGKTVMHQPYYKSSDVFFCSRNTFKQSLQLDKDVSQLFHSHCAV